MTHIVGLLYVLKSTLLYKFLALSRNKTYFEIKNDILKMIGRCLGKRLHILAVCRSVFLITNHTLINPTSMFGTGWLFLGLSFFIFADWYDSIWFQLVNMQYVIRLYSLDGPSDRVCQWNKDRIISICERQNSLSVWSVCMNKHRLSCLHCLDGPMYIHKEL